MEHDSDALVADLSVDKMYVGFFLLRPERNAIRMFLWFFTLHMSPELNR